MARKPRIYYPGALYHVILRGNGGQDFFFDDQDRTRFYFLIQEGIERFGHCIHAVLPDEHSCSSGNPGGRGFTFPNSAKSKFSLYPMDQLTSQSIRSSFSGAIQGCARGCGSLFIGADALPPFKSGEGRDGDGAGGVPVEWAPCLSWS